MNDAESRPAPPPRERIMAAAFGAFMDRGYAGASTAEIARRAKVSKRDLYAAFGSKHAMLAACITERTARMRRPLRLPPPRTRDALAATLEGFGTQLLLEVSRPEVLAMHRLAILEAERAPEVAQTLDALGRGDNVSALAGLLRMAMEGQVLPAGDAETMAEVFLAMLWRGGLLMRLMLAVTTPPDAAEAAARARFATKTMLACASAGGQSEAG